MSGAASVLDPGLLSKSRFLAGLQCQKRLYLQVRDNSPRSELSRGDRYRIDEGNAITELARRLFPEGVLVNPRAANKSAVNITAELLTDPAVPAIFEATIVADDILIKADILERVGPGEWRLIEVKSATKEKEDHLPDLAIQTHVLARAGIRLRSSCLMLLSREYIYPGGPLHLPSLFSIHDLSAAVAEFLEQIETYLDQQRATLRLTASPEIAPGKHCSAPRECEFFSQCNPEPAPDDLCYVPKLSAKKAALLKELGVVSINGIPDDFELTPVQRRVAECVKSGVRYFSADLAEKLDELVWPVLYMDFETWGSAIPSLTGTRTYDAIPFQWSVHVEEAPGAELTHLEFLGDAHGDPRPAFLETLLTVVESHAGSIVVYSAFEATQLRALSVSLPGSAERIERIYSRLWDLLAFIREHVYYPEFNGSFSIKKVLPAMQPDLSYSHLMIRDGASAGAAYAEIRKTTDHRERTALREGLLAYCRQDTLAMYELIRVLRRAVRPLGAGSSV